MIKNIEQETENSILEMAMGYLDAPELHLSGDDKVSGRNVSGEFKLLDRHLPTLQSGEYEITVRQTISGKGIENGNVFSSQQKIKVVGTAYQLKPDDIFSVFPPNAATGDFSTYLPHIVLNRSTIPWERKAFDGAKNTPWLALVVLSETDIDVKKTVKSGDSITFDAALLTLADLADLAHVIQRLDKSEQAVIISNRLPKTGTTNAVHLVAIDKDSFPNGQIPEGEQSFISLHNWQINCFGSEKEPLNSDFTRLKAGLLRLPIANTEEKYQDYYSKGFVPLPHFTRLGEQTVSWYRSPLVPQTKSKGIVFKNANHSDALLRYHSTSKMLDTTYAAAWELGRLLTLKEKDIAQAIYVWKRGMVQQNKQETDELASLISGKTEDAISILQKEFFAKKKAAAIDYYHLSTFFLISKQFEKAEKICKEGITLDSSEIFLQLQLAHIYLFTDRLSEAKLIHQKYKDQNVNSKTSWKKQTETDFLLFEKNNLSNKYFKKIIKILD